MHTQGVVRVSIYGETELSVHESLNTRRLCTGDEKLFEGEVGIHSVLETITYLLRTRHKFFGD